MYRPLYCTPLTRTPHLSSFPATVIWKSPIAIEAHRIFYTFQSPADYDKLLPIYNIIKWGQ